MPEIGSPEFVFWFRQAAPYIHAFRDRTFVVAFGGDLIRDGDFGSLAHDLNTLVSLGVNLVLVHGARPQISQRLEEAGLPLRLERGVRVTERDAIVPVLQAIGQVRFEIEAGLSMGLANSPMANADIRVAGGNFVTAQPMGVREGEDMQYTGEVRKLDVAAMRDRLEFGETILLSPLGYSPTGEVFNLTLEDVATTAAVALEADKLIFLLDQPGVVDEGGELLNEMTAAEAEAYLPNEANTTTDLDFYLPCCIRAVRHGVQRAHLISRHLDGAMLTELFTHDGIGTMISREPLETLRRAVIDDIGGILALIEPLEEQGVLVKRSRELLEREVERFAVLEHDRKIVGCVSLHTFEESEIAELAGLAVHPDYRDGGRGEQLLKHVEREAKRLKITRLFVLTTRTAHWFVERGFVPAEIDVLPIKKKELYNWQRRSKVFIKIL
ncbi:amino-acid N-acetyltransferase [Chitinimonas sp. BJB300]|uniref:amino-acid N-acetyltransferase n=1 Tax=Chitinimonas sp. BJB300 TaxID=1559339 RepID=UPI000C0CCDAC|nr:amino-acid N-acetyltransferase [Chitinimonas sp. BJB300]PHV09778.1 amino-acid N-acetyltransferase [Chitinimonas sp. BJB300]TSJ91096.1 amino-acid N-acetyltransferase [Chitinimonas sp. BJB300]